MQDLTKNPDDLKRIINGLRPTRKAVESPWMQTESYFEGSKARETYLDKEHSYQIFDGKKTIYYDGSNKQANILGESARTRFLAKLREFRAVPDPDARGYRVIKHVGEVIGITGSNEHFTTNFDVQTATGMIKRSIVQTKDGLITGEIFQDGFVTYPGGIVFPTLSAKAKFVGGALSMIRITVLEEAQFNVPLPADAFEAEVPQGVNVFDQRGKDITTFKTAAPLGDLAVAANERLQPSSRTLDSGKADFAWRWWVIAGNILLLLLVVGGWLIWRRRTGWQRSR